MQALATGQGLKPATHTLLLTATGPARQCGTRRSPAADHITWGLGVGLQESTRGQAFWHWGDNGDFKNLFMVFPATGESIVLLTNSANGLLAAPDILELFMGPDSYWALTWLQEQ